MATTKRKPRPARGSNGRRAQRSPLDLTEFQRRFVQEYLVDLCGAAAARRAGSRAKEPKKAADKLLCLPKVTAAIAEAMKKRAERTEIDADRVVQELAKIAFANMQDFVSIKTEGKEKGQAAIDLSRLTRDQFAAIGEITIEDIDFGRRTGKRTKFKLLDKRQALVDLGKHLGLFVERSKVEHNVSIAELEDASRRLEDKLVHLVASKYSQRSTGSIH